MSIGSVPGERRGGRSAGTPNRATALRQFAAAEAAATLARVSGQARDCTAEDILAIQAADAADGATITHEDAATKRDLRPFEGNALQFMQLVYRDPRLPRGMRLDAAKSAVRYEVPSLAAVTLAGDADNPVTLRTIDARTPLDGRMTALLLAAQVPVTTHDVDDAGETTHTVTE